MSETALRSAIVTALNATRLCHVWSVHAGMVKVRGGRMHLCPVGTPDICGYARDGRFIGIEVKVRGNSTNKERAEKQRAFQVDIAAKGGIAGQVESVHAAVAIIDAELLGGKK